MIVKHIFAIIYIHNCELKPIVNITNETIFPFRHREGILKLLSNLLLLYFSRLLNILLITLMYYFY